MYYPIVGGEKVIVDDLTCWLPPVPKDKSQILYYNLPKEEQYWRREPVPQWYWDRVPDENKARRIEEDMVERGMKKSVTYLDPVLERYRRREWHRRKWGVWFYNYGVPTYITGHHYWYLNYCKFDHKINDGYPLYYEFSRDNFYFRQYCEEDPKCLGYFFVAARGTGKSNEELACVSNNITMKHDARAALQSKSFDKDAKAVLMKAKLVPLFNNLPQFFKPQFAHGSNPEERLIFNRPSTKGKESFNIKYGPELELNSYIFAAYPGEKALDTETLTEVLIDEVGKTNPKKIADVVVRHNVNLKCVFRNHRKVGMLRNTTTVEEMDEGGAEALLLWKASNQRKRDRSGHTESKIYRRFISALTTDTSLDDYIEYDENGVIIKNWGPPCDKHGRVNAQIANRKIENDLEMVKHNLRERSSRIRKSPRNEYEAFIKDQSKSIFNVEALTSRLEEIRNMPKAPYIRGNLYWLKDEGGPVGFKQDEHAGRFYWAWFPDEFSGNPEPGKWKILNNVRKEAGWDRMGNRRVMTYPKNDHLFTIGTDPIKFSKTKDPRASKASGHGFRKYNINVDNGRPKAKWQSHNYIFEYIERPQDPETYFNDMGMACHFLGCSILPESNIKSLVQHFVQKGWEKFLMNAGDFPDLMIAGNQDDPGFSTTAEVIDQYTRRIITFINEHIQRMPFDRTIESWLNFDPSDTRVSDATVSSGFTLVALENKPREQETVEEDINDWFDVYDNSGTIGRTVDINEFRDYDDGGDEYDNRKIA